MPQLLHDLLPEHLLRKHDRRGVVAWMEGNLPFTLHLVVEHERDALVGVEPQAQRRQAAGFQTEQARQAVAGREGQARNVQLLTRVGGAEGLVRQCDVQIEGGLLAIAQQNVLAEGDIGRDKRERQALLHRENGVVVVNLAGERKRLQLGKHTLLVGHGDNLLRALSGLDVKNSRKQEQNRQFRQNDSGNFAASML